MKKQKELKIFRLISKMMIPLFHGIRLYRFTVNRCRPMSFISVMRIPEEFVQEWR